MAPRDEPSYTDLVYEVLRSEKRPLAFVEIVDAVSRRRPITTKNPRSTIRNALTQGRQLVNTGNGTYGYLPHLIEGSLLRLPLTEKKPANHPLVYPDEVRHALWPSFFESAKRETRAPVSLRLPTGVEVTLSLGGVGPLMGAWDSPLSEELRRYLVTNYAGPGDSLLIRITNGEPMRGDLEFESRRKRDSAAVDRRNRALSDAVDALLRTSRSREQPIWDLVIRLLARGFYRDSPAPDALETVLKGDPRVAPAGMDQWMLSEDLTPEYAEEIRLRTEVLGRLLQPSTPSLPSVGAGDSILNSRRAGERSFADIGALLRGQEFGSADEANAFLQGLMAQGGVPHRGATTPLGQAQDLMYEAWESSDPAKRIRLAREALRISPDCADAYVLLAEETARSAPDAAELYAKGVAAGERALGPGAFADEVGHFWGIIETRPYMRARLGLAQALWAMEKRREAIDHAWELLRLNPGDNQGVRYLLLSWLLEMGDVAPVARLFELYPDDGSAAWLYARALHAFRSEGKTKRSEAYLVEAKQQNSLVPAYLLGKKRLPTRLPQTMGFGDESEAVHYAAEQFAAWRKTPGALAWLAG